MRLRNPECSTRGSPFGRVPLLLGMPTAHKDYQMMSTKVGVEIGFRWESLWSTDSDPATMR